MEKLRYLKHSDEDVVKEMERRLKEIKELLTEIRDILRSAGEVD